MDRRRTHPLTLSVSLAAQRLDVLRDGNAEVSFMISSSKHGAGEINGSFRTPRGRHVVRAKIGAGLPLNAVLKARRPTGEIYSAALAERFPDRDWILTRILWLSGIEIGKNRLGNVDTMRRYIYIHGMPETEPLGVPGSIGCIRMANRDIVELFDLVPTGTIIDID